METSYMQLAQQNTFQASNSFEKLNKLGLS